MGALSHRTAWWFALAAFVGLTMPACAGDDAENPDPRPDSSGSPAASPRAAAACLAFGGAPDGSAAHPYLKRSMALDCRDDVKRLQLALGMEADGFFDSEVAEAVIEATAPFACITANDGQVGPQTWALIVEGTEPCRPGRTVAPAPTWARCGSGTLANWALRTVGETVLRRCGEQLELVHERQTHVGAVTELGSSVCAEFNETFDAPTARTILCVSDPATDDTLEASATVDDGGAVWSGQIESRYVPD